MEKMINVNSAEQIVDELEVSESLLILPTKIKVIEASDEEIFRMYLEDAQDEDDDMEDED
ncbi:hypothetical protein FQ087_02880 [Sporosarcina sp. ANT_H38]|uniref:hypothetical protein n=1 Tax=Sporosarcina sp. ANT_H38 TaxID=2597358 RepID=UPI0011F380B4|nr:hypothetical protein [Sporosarcina sp. ANT_H38]KAA0965269.1 hypothetical protein FQ087_02880 [Sporosarcina sp. ANT_H38]